MACTMNGYRTDQRPCDASHENCAQDASQNSATPQEPPSTQYLTYCKNHIATQLRMRHKSVVLAVFSEELGFSYQFEDRGTGTRRGPIQTGFRGLGARE